jgi:tRNA dimethylallyltransferase
MGDSHTTDRRAPLWVLAGPTASGKTAVSLRVAERLGLELCSMDSMLVYRGMDVGTAKPSPAERARVPHHGIDLVEPSATFGVQDWLAEAGAAEARAAARGRALLFVGGTAFYLKALVSGLFQGPAPDPALRAELERAFDERGAAALHAELAAVDPHSAARLHAHDRKRVVRALEVWRQTGRALSQWQTQWSAAPARELRLVALALAPQRLAERIEARTRALFDAGWEDELRGLLARGGLGPTAAQALGYAEVARLVRGELTRVAAQAQVSAATRRFARKQRTWLRGFAGRVEVAAPRDDAADMERAAEEVLAALVASDAERRP